MRRSFFVVIGIAVVFVVGLLFAGTVFSDDPEATPITAPQGFAAIAGVTRTVPAGGSWNSCYQASSPGDICQVSAGTYPGQTIAWRGDLSNKCDRTNPASLIRFMATSGVTVNGELEVDGPCVGVIGGNINGEVSAFGNYPNQIPDNILFQGMHSVHIGNLTGDHVTFDQMDVGPATVIDTGTPNDGVGCTAKEGPGDENKVVARWGAVVSGQGHVPVDTVISNSKIHNQQGVNPDRGECHYGGLFIVNADGLLVTKTQFYENVVYHVQIQNFSGPPVTNVKFDSDAFGCPTDWGAEAAPCDGQRAIQFDYDPSTQVTLSNNVAANGSNGLYGCYVGTCGGLTGVKDINNTNLAQSKTPPPVPSGGGGTTSTSTTISSSTSTSTTTVTQPKFSKCDEFNDFLVKSSPWKSYAKANRKESAAVASFYCGGTEPTVNTLFGIFLVDMGKQVG